METTTPPAPPALDADVAPPTGAHPHAEEVASWMLEGCFFTVDTDGAITMWSPRAAEEFAWSRRDIVKSGFTDTLLAPGERDAHAGRLRALLGGAEDATSFRAEVDAVDATGAGMRVAFAAVRIHVGVGYEFNALLHEVASSSQTARSLEQLKARSDSVLALIDDAVHGRHAELAESEDARRLAGALVAFRVLGRSAAPAAPIAGDEDGAVQAAIAAALLEAEEARAQAAGASARMDEAVAESEQLRAELTDAHGRAAADAERSRDALARARKEALADSQRLAAELLEAREGLGAEAERLLAELQGSRERAAAALEQVNAELASARADAEAAAGALAEARSELEQRVAQLDAAQARDGALRTELEALSAEAAEARARAERAAAELEQARVALDRERLTGRQAAAAEAAPSSPGEASDALAEAEALRRELTRLRHEADSASERAASDVAEARAQAQQSERELAEARRSSGRHDAELQAAAARAEAMQKELAVIAEQAAQAQAQAERARTKLDGAEAELAHVRAAREAAAAAGRDESDRLGAELRGARAELDRLQRELDGAKAQSERAAALAQEEMTASREEIARLKAELKSARAVTPVVEPTVPAAPAPSIAKQRASQYLDYLLTAEVVAEDAAAPQPREPIAIGTLHQMARDIDAKNPYTRRHSERVAGYAAALAEGLGFERPRIEAIRQAALLHDVGKSEVLESIVAKDDPLNLEEIDEMARHSQIGRDLLVAAGEPKLAEWVRHIHERFDGGGYPIGLGGAEIPEESRVLHAADALDHMTRPRAYRRNRPVREALAEIAFCAGTRLDPNIATTMIDLVESGRIKVEGPAGPQRIGRPLGGPR